MEIFVLFMFGPTIVVYRSSVFDWGGGHSEYTPCDVTIKEMMISTYLPHSFAIGEEATGLYHGGGYSIFWGSCDNGLVLFWLFVCLQLFVSQ